MPQDSARTGASDQAGGDRAGSNIALIRLSSFGDIVLTEPVARAVKERYPRCTLWFVTGSAYLGLLELFPSVDRVVGYEREGSNRALVELARDVDFDLLVDLHNNLRSRRVGRLLGATRTLRHKRQRLRRFLSVYLPWIWKGPLRHTIKTYFDTVAPLGIRASCVSSGVGRDAGREPADLLTPRLVPPTSAAERAAEILGAGAGKDLLVGICPGGSSVHKRWGDRQFADLIRILSSRGRRVAMVGSQQDGSAARPLLDALRPESDGAGRHGEAMQGGVKTYFGNDIGLIAGVLSLCRVTVTNDSGLMHLAGAVGSRVVAIFGPTSPSLGFGPSAEGSIVVRRDLACSPCSYHGNKPCKYGTRECFEAITPAEVADLVDQLLT